MKTTTFNRHIQAGQAAAEEHLPALERGYRQALETAGTEAGRLFARLATDHMVADATNPSWTPPEVDELVDSAQLQADAKKRTASAQKKTLQAVVSPVLADIGVSYTLENPMVARLLTGAGVRARDLNDALREQIAKAVLDGYQQGSTVEQTAKAIKTAAWEIAPSRARMLARTDLVGLANAGSLAVAQLVTGDSYGGETDLAYKSWLSTADERTRETHADADGQVVPLDQPFSVGGELLLYPGDVDGSDEEVANCRCVGPDVRVSGRLGSAMRRPFEGHLARLTTAGGRQVSVTANHPILTNRGWVHAGLVERGDDLICDLRLDRAAGSPDVEDVPAAAHQLFAARKLARGGSERISGSGVDFHGERSVGEVEIVGADDRLSLEAMSSFDQHLVQLALSLAHREMSVDRDDSSGAGVTEPDRVRLTASAKNDPSSRQNLRDRCALDTETVMQLKDAVPIGVGVADVVGYTGMAFVEERPARFGMSPADLSFAETLPDGHRSDAELVRDLLVGHPGLVEADPVVDVDVLQFRGHVYNFSSATGTFAAEGIITANCTVTYLSAAEAASEGGDGEIALAAAVRSPADDVASAGHMTESPDDTLTADVTITVGDDSTQEQAAEAPETSTRWRAILCIEGKETQDNASLSRMLAVGETTWRDLPLPLGVMYETPHSDDVKAELCGLIDTIYRDETDFRVIWGEGVFNGDEQGARAAARIADLSLRGVSIDPYVPELEIFEENATSENGVPHSLMVMHNAVICAATVCPVQAIDGAQISIIASTEPEIMPFRSETCFVLTASSPPPPVPIPPPPDLPGVDLASLSAQISDLRSLVEQEHASRRATIASMLL